MNRSNLILISLSFLLAALLYFLTGCASEVKCKTVCPPDGCRRVCMNEDDW